MRGWRNRDEEQTMTILRFEQAIEPEVSLRESSVPGGAWRRLERAFSSLERAASRCMLAAPTLELGDGSVLRVEAAGPSTVATYFESAAAQRTWCELDWSEPGAAGCAPGFVRLWRAGAEELFCEDVDWLVDAGVDVFGRGAVVGVRFSDRGLWEDVDARRVEQLVAMCRQAAARLVAGDLAA
jgi:hypothetical protein